MLTARLGVDVIRAGVHLQSKRDDFVFRCRDEECEHPELELVIGRGLRVPHFRHKRRGKCGCPDGETPWHLEWKSNFERVEVDMGVDPVTGELNRADAVVGNNFVVEFQHSHIKEKEQSDRERYYSSTGGMVWIVDASGKRNLQRLERAIRQEDIQTARMPPFDKAPYIIVSFPEETLPMLWIDREIGVVLDYGKERDLLYIVPGHDKQDYFDVLCRWFKRDELIERLKTHPEYFRMTEKNLIAIYKKQKENEQIRINDLMVRRAHLKETLEKAWQRASNAQRQLPYGKVAFEAVKEYNVLVRYDGLVFRPNPKTGVLELVENLRPPLAYANRGRRNYRM